ncbi:MAG: DUF3853 family protein [Bacteroidales bacterium]
MNANYNANTPLWHLSIGEFQELIADSLKQAQEAQPVAEAKPEHKFVYGLKGLAQLLGCSETTAWHIKTSGKIDEAISQVQRKIVVDAELALRLLKLNKKPIKK